MKDSEIQKKLRRELKRFETFSDGFDFCREADRPVRVKIGDYKWKLFPSGSAKQILDHFRIRIWNGRDDMEISGYYGNDYEAIEAGWKYLDEQFGGEGFVYGADRIGLEMLTTLDKKS